MNIADFKSPSNFDERYASRPNVRSPHGKEDVRCREDLCWSNVILVKFESKLYLVMSNLFQVLAGKMFSASLYATISDSSEVFLWVVKLSSPTAVEAVKTACQKWCRVIWNNGIKGYQIQDAENHGNPDWRIDNFDQFVESAFAGRVLDDPNHQIVRKILGQE